MYTSSMGSAGIRKRSSLCADRDNTVIAVAAAASGAQRRRQREAPKTTSGACRARTAGRPQENESPAAALTRLAAVLEVTDM